MGVSAGGEFPGTDRFEVRRRLGAGAYGVVYETFDRERGSLVALKTLRPGNVEALYRLKREFRALADISHPNLAALYELLTESEQWFFTMELVHGSNFLQYVRARSAPPAAGETLDPTLSEPPAEDRSHPSEPAWTPPRGLPFDPARLRDALRQTASGLSA